MGPSSWICFLGLLVLASPDDAAPPQAPLPQHLRFVENQGQWESDARYLARAGRHVVRAHDDRLVVQLRSAEDPRRGTAVHLVLERAVTPVARESLPGYENFLHGDEPSLWRGHVPAFAEVVYEEIAPGVDLLVRSTAEGELELRALSSLPLAQPVGLRCEGADVLWSEDSAEIVTPHGVLRLAGEGLRLDQGLIVIEARAMHSLAEAVVEGDALPPGLESATYIGGSAVEDQVRGITFTENGGVIVTGGTYYSTDFPVTPGAFDTTQNNPVTPFTYDVFVAEFDTQAQLVFATYLGGHNYEGPVGVALRDDGAICVAGETTSSNFPKTPGAWDTTFALGDAFVSALSRDGSSLIFSTFVGGSSTDFLETMFLDGSGRMTIAGNTLSHDFPTTATAVDKLGSQKANNFDAFVCQLERDGSGLVYSTYLSGDGADRPFGVHVDGQGLITLGGRGSTGMPVTPGALQEVPTASFVARIDTEHGLVFLTYFHSLIHGLDVDPSGATVIVGMDGGGLPVTPGVIMPDYAGTLDGFVAKLDPTGSELVYATFFGGGWMENMLEVSVDSAGVATVLGRSNSSDLPTTKGAVIEVKSTEFDDDLVLARIDPLGRSLYYSTYFGGSFGEGGNGSTDHMALVVDEYGRAAIASRTNSFDLPVSPGTLPKSRGVDAEAFVAVLSLLPEGVTRFGASTPGCAGILAMGISRQPQNDGRPVLLTCTNAPPLGFGLLAIGRPLPAPQIVSGVQAWVDPQSLLAVVPAQSDRLGYGVVDLAIPADPHLVGATVAAQFFWHDPCAGGVSASNALELVVQP